MPKPSPLAFVVCVCLPAVAQETVFVHRAAGREVGRTTVVRAQGVVRGEGAESADGGRLVAVMETASDGRVTSYERELRGRGGALVGRVSVVATDDGARVRDAGPLGSRTRTAPGGAFDAVVDPAFPEALFGPLAERGRTSLRVLIVAEAEIRTILVSARGERARYAELPGGGLTVRFDAEGAVVSATLPGAETREILRGDVASRPTAPPPDAEEERFALPFDAGGGAAGTIAGVVLKPKRPLPPPALVVLIGDAGPIDRDGLGGGRNAPTLRLFAEECARLGIASVRADKRGTGESAGPEAGLGDLADDALRALRRARVSTGAESRRTILVGHGEGAVVAAEAAARAPAEIGGVVSLAGPGRSLIDALEVRLRVRLKAAGETDEEVEARAAELRDEVARLRDGEEPAPPGRRLLRDLARTDPATQLAKLRTPVLVVHAAEDPETPPSHVSLLRASLAFSSAARIRFQLLDRADHDFLLVPEGAGLQRRLPGEADTARPLHPSAAALVADFVASLP